MHHDLSNKPIYTREDYAAKLTRLGIPTEPVDVVNSTYVLIRYLGKIAPGALEAADCLLIGDRLETDIRMGLESGMETALVLSGVTEGKALETSPIRPDHVFQSIADLEFLLR